jgi:hypothetical protein
MFGSSTTLTADWMARTNAISYLGPIRPAAPPPAPQVSKPETVVRAWPPMASVPPLVPDDTATVIAAKSPDAAADEATSVAARDALRGLSIQQRIDLDSDREIARKLAVANLERERVHAVIEGLGQGALSAMVDLIREGSQTPEGTTAEARAAYNETAATKAESRPAVA